jgi:hypothetical protein
MKILTVPFLCDTPEGRGGFIKSKMSGDIGYLDRDGHLHLVSQTVVDAISELSDERDALARTIEQMKTSGVVPERDISVAKFICYADRMKKIFG